MAGVVGAASLFALAPAGAAADQPDTKPSASAPASPSTPPPAERPISELKIDSMSPSPGTYGTGIVIRVKFNNSVPKEARDEVLNHITVETSKPIGEAGWAWLDDRTAVYRPKDFWPGNTKVEVRSYRTVAVVASDDIRDYVWTGEWDRSFTIGRSQEIHIDNATHMAKVVRDGKTVRTMPIALGKPGWETRSGVKVLMEGYEVKRMTGASIGAEEDYELDVPYAIRLTNSGEFIHAAPWAAGNLGRVNGSHGCTNLSMSDAQWLFSNRLYGDPVITKGTGRGMETGNGAGGVWNVSWAKWSQGIAS